MKLKGFLATAMLTCLMLFGFGAKVSAISQEEQAVIETNKSEMATWIDEDLKVVILQVASTVSGVVISMALFLKSIKSLTDFFKKNADKNEDASLTMKECQKDIKQDNLSTKEAIEKSNAETLKMIQEDNEATRKEIEKLTSVFGIAFSNDAKLVKNGAANEIMKVLGGNNEDTKA